MKRPFELMALRVDTYSLALAAVNGMQLCDAILAHPESTDEERKLARAARRQFRTMHDRRQQHGDTID